jgi:TPR repeat protein/S1-C subfamily serine protease
MRFTLLFRAALAAWLMVAALVGAAVAGPLDDAMEAYTHRDYAGALRIWQPLAEQGNAVAQSDLGYLYHSGKGVPEDYSEAVRWYRKSANQGDVSAQSRLGGMYKLGLGVPRNYVVAYMWYTLASSSLSGTARARVPRQMAFDDRNALVAKMTSAEIAEAQKMSERCLRSNYADCESPQFDIGEALQTGKWIEAATAAYQRGDYATALRITQPLAERGDDAEAQFGLGYLYQQGQGVRQSYAEALKWYIKSANRGNVSAQMQLGVMYQDGKGVPQNHVLAYMWYTLAGTRSTHTPAAIDLRRDLAAKMTPAQIEEGQRKSERCLQSHYADCELPQVARGEASQVARREDKAAPSTTLRTEVASTGTGFFVSETGHIVTNAHVVKDCQTVRSSRGGTLRKVSVDEESDLAIYIASEKPDTFARLRGGRGARAGESVVAVGFPLTGVLSSDPIVTTGIISALSGLRNDRRTIQITAPVQPGNSGGPLLGENGGVVGVVVGKLNAVKVAEAIGDIPQNVNFAVSLGTLQSFLNANGIPYALDDSSCFLGRFLCSKATKTPADITAEATRYTVLLECLR